MMKQYFEMKEKYPNTILFFRLGDFYEMFFNDAKTVSRELELTLTGRECGQEERAPMCGVPFHSAESYIAKLVAKGYKVAICEQLEDPKLAKGLVKRDVIRVITPGTVVENSMLDETRNNFLCSICYEEDGLGLCFGDISTGDLTADQVLAPNSETLPHILEDRLARYSPTPRWSARRARCTRIWASAKRGSAASLAARAWPSWSSPTSPWRSRR